MKRILLSVFIIGIMAALANAESCSTLGEVGKKYTQVSECKYTTQTRTCCGPDASGSYYWWSEWNENCTKEERCWNGKDLVSKPDVSSEGSTSNKIPPSLQGYCGDEYCNTAAYKGNNFDKIITPVRYKLNSGGSCKCKKNSGWDCPFVMTYTVLSGSAQVIVGEHWDSWKTCAGLSSSDLAKIIGGLTSVITGGVM